jgi:hypothetical protein
LVTPGETVPENVPDGLETVETQHGTVIFNPDKTTKDSIEQAAAGEVFDGSVLGMTGEVPESGAAELAVTATTPEGAVVQSEAVDPANVPAAQAAAQAAAPGATVEVVPAQSVIQRRKPRRIGSRAQLRLDAEEDIGGPDIISWLSENRVISKTRALKQRGEEWFAKNKSLWDDAPARLAAIHHNVIFAESVQSGLYPDVAAQAAFEAGVIPEPSVNVFWKAVIDSSARRAGYQRAQREEDAKAWKQASDEEFQYHASTREEGDLTISTEELASGDLLVIDGTEFKVTEVDYDRGVVTLEDGKRWGVQKMPTGEVVYVEQYIASEDPSQGDVEFFGAPESIEDQRAREDREAATKEKQRQRRDIEKGANAPLTGSMGDIGQGDLLGNVDPEAPVPDLFAAPSPKPKEDLAAENAKPPSEPATPPPLPPPPAELTPEQKAAADLEAALGDLADILTAGIKKTIVPLDEQRLIPVMVRVFDAAFRLGYTKFKTAAKFVLDTIRSKMGDEAADSIQIEHLQGGYIGMSPKYRGMGVDSAKDVVIVDSIAELAALDDAPPIPTDPPGQPQPPQEPEPQLPVELQQPTEKLDGAAFVSAFTEAHEDIFRGAESWFEAGKSLTKRQVAALAKHRGITVKEVEELIEAAAARLLSRVASSNSESPRGDEATIEFAVRLYNEQMPPLTERTVDSKEAQAYSSPPPLAAITSAVLKRMAPSPVNRVVDTSVGNGMLLAPFASKERKFSVVGWDIDPARVERAGKVLSGDFLATTLATRDSSIAAGTLPRVYELASINPPFGGKFQDDGSPVVFDLAPALPQGAQAGDNTTKSIDVAILFNTLRMLKDNGAAVIVIGAKTGSQGASFGANESRANAYKRADFLSLFKGYRVLDWVTVDGSLYRGMGAGWPVDVIVVEGRTPTPGADQGGFVRPWVKPPDVVTSWKQLAERFGYAVETNESARRASGPETPGGGTGGGRASGGRRGSGTGGRPRATQPDAVAGGGGSPGLQQPDTGGEQAGLGTGNDSGDGSPVLPAGDGETAGESQPAGSLTDGGEPLDADAASSVAEELKPLVSYRSASKMPSDPVLAPNGMADQMAAALAKVEEDMGKPVDQIVADELGMTMAELRNSLSGAQVDALAIQIRNFYKSTALVNADGTGVGKGRTVAAFIRFLLRKNMVPVFVTQTKDPLYSDMLYRDLAALGVTLNPYITDNNVVLFDQNENAIRISRSAKELDADMESVVTTNQLPEGFNAIFTTYYQLNKDKPRGWKETAKDKARRKKDGNEKPVGPIWSAIRALPNAYFIMDEAHNAAGETSDNMVRIKNTLQWQKRGAYFLSATWAKRPGNLALYAAANSVGKIGVDFNQLLDAFVKGGAPLQQATASSLAANGELIRRELDYSGVRFDFVKATSNPEREVELADQYSDFLVQLLDISRAMARVVQQLQKIEDQITAQSTSVTLESVNFGAAIYNMSKQYLLSLKTDAVVKEAIAAINRGQKPFIALENTMQGPIEKLTAKGYRLDFSGILRLQLDRLLSYKRKDPSAPEGDQVQTVEIPLDELPGGVRAMVDSFLSQLDTTDFTGMPISPIDYMASKLREEGIQVVELTGRSSEVVEDEDGIFVSQKIESKKDKTEKLLIFNNTPRTAAIANVSAATGLSAHADPRFRDQSQRVMIMGQPPSDVNAFQQMIGRIMRYGQTSLPEYKIISSELAADRRFMVFLRKKLVSLNANVSADTESQVTRQEGIEEDVFNVVGDMVVWNVLSARPDIVGMLGIAMPASDEIWEDFARKVTGYFPLLPNADADAMWNDITREYQETIRILDESGENPLRSRVRQWKAQTLESRVVEEASDFGSAIVVEKLKIPIEEMPRMAYEVSFYFNDEALRDWESKAQQFLAVRTATMRSKGVDNDQIELVRDKVIAVGRALREIRDLLISNPRLVLPAGESTYLYGIASSVSINTNPEGFTQISSHRVRIATPYAYQTNRMVPLSQVHDAVEAMGSTGKKAQARDAADMWRSAIGITANRLFDEQFNDAIESEGVTTVATGNLIRAYTMSAGRIVQFTRADGRVETGILLTDELMGVTKREVKDAAELARLISSGSPIVTPGDIIKIVDSEILEVDASQRGRWLWGSPEFRGASGWSNMRGSRGRVGVRDVGLMAAFLFGHHSKGTKGFKIYAEEGKAC